MFSGLEDKQLAGALEALLFVSDEPVSTLVLADMLEVEPSEVERALTEMRVRFEEENRGIQLREIAGGWRLFTHPAYHELLERYVLSWDTRRLSQAAMETLAIIAYGQPITRAGVASVRGVNSDSSINSLIEKGLLHEVGTADTPGQPVLYGTTRTFLEKFGLRSVKDLPPLEDFAPDEETARFIRQRLSATTGVSVIPEHLRVTEPLQNSSEEVVPEGSLSGEDGASGADQESEDMQRKFVSALAGSFGLVEKIDFDELQFETDEE